MRALELVRANALASIVNHSLRTYLHAALAARRLDDVVDSDLLFFACVFHDIGTAARYDGQQRFEVEGADAAAQFLTTEGVDPARIDQVWEAIALHTSPGIAERRGPISRLTRLGVLVDLGRARCATADQKALIEQCYPRLEVEQALADAVVRQALTQPDKAPRSS